MNDDDRVESAHGETSENQLADSAADEGELSDRCGTERDAMTPRETADCAGSDLAGLYDNEEDGGS